MNICIDHRRGVVSSANSSNRRRRILHAAATCVAIENLESRTLLAAAFDNSFAGDGTIDTPEFQDMSVLSDNKILGTRVDNISPSTIKLHRFNANGTADTTYGSGGVVSASVPFGPSVTQVVGNKVYVAGSGSHAYQLARYNLDGTLDNTFGGDGVAGADFEPFFDQRLSGSPTHILPAADGDIVVGGWLEPDGSIDQQAGIARFNSDGTLDTTFDGDGTVEGYIPPHSLGPGQYTLMSNGDIFTRVGYYDGQGANQYHEIYGWHRDGSRFSGPDPQPQASQSNGKTLAIAEDRRRLIRYNADYTNDTTFNGNALSLTEPDHITDIHVLPDDRILVAASLYDGVSQTRGLIARLLSNGAPDTSFGPAGRFYYDQGYQDSGRDFEITPDGRIVFRTTYTTVFLGSERQHGLIRLVEPGSGAQSPVYATPFTIGSTIQSEDFDNGGQGVAYNDFDATNNGGAYRTGEGVDIEVTADTGGGYDVGWTMPGEWLEYTIEVFAPDNYVIDTRLASPKTGGSFHYEIDGVNITGNVSIPNTGGFQNWRTITSNLGTLSVGEHVLRLVMHSSPNTGGQANFNWLRINRADGGSGAGRGLKAEYFNNMDFTAPALTRTDATVNFNWGSGSPDPSIQPDTFSVRWSGRVGAPVSGRYTFYTTTDDGVRLWVNGQLLIDRFTPQAATEYSGSIDLVGNEDYEIRMEYFERFGGASAKLSWSGPGIAKQIVPKAWLSSDTTSGTDTQAPSAVSNFQATRIAANEIDVRWDAATDNVGVTGYQLQINDEATFTVSSGTRAHTFRNLAPSSTQRIQISAFDGAGNRGPATTIQATTSPGPTPAGNGLSGTYFNSMDFTGPVFTRTDAKIDFNWGTGSPDSRIDGDTFSVRWTGQILAPATGRYTFYTTSDDGARLTINGQRIIDKMIPQAATEWSGSIDLVAGQKYNIALEYFERFGGALAKLQWSGPGITKQVVPQANLFS